MFQQNPELVIVAFRSAKVASKSVADRLHCAVIYIDEQARLTSAAVRETLPLDRHNRQR